jgi:hypothetical protein
LAKDAIGWGDQAKTLEIGLEYHWAFPILLVAEGAIRISSVRRNRTHEFAEKVK